MRVKRNEKHKPSGSAAKPKTKWPYYDLMSFLDKFSEARETSGNVQEPLNQPELLSELQDETPTHEEVLTAEENFENSLAVEQPETSNTKERPETSNTKVNIKKKFSRKRQAAKEDDIDSQYLAELKKINSSRVDENDPDRMFLLSLLPSMKNLTPADNMDFRLNALQFLKGKLNPTSSGHNVTWLQSQPTQSSWSESHRDLTSPASSTSVATSIHYIEPENQIPSAPQHFNNYTNL